ncbi:hypothetical protein Slala03_31330 [Streptomyces lavendulae subsp. lavendulae]|nr:hypothetical protein Slala03_31330 [Streptomyces lavendulae subsp. lavendulae]
MLGAHGAARGPASPRNPLIRPLGGPGPRPSPDRRRAGPPADPPVRPRQPSGGEKTTITFNGSVMWWNLCGTPAGT